MEKFTTYHDYKAWLDSQSLDVCMVMATRAALRPLPYLFANQRLVETPVGLAAIRALIVSAVAAVVPSPKMTEQYVLAANAASRALSKAAFATKHAIFEENDSLPRSIRFAEESAELAASTVGHYHGRQSRYGTVNDATDSAFSAAAKSEEPTILSAVFSDAVLVASKFSAKSLIDQNLWPGTEKFEGLDTGSIITAARSNSAWQFWADWYDGFLRGEPLDWYLQEQIALIPHEQWGNPERIASEIARIKNEMAAERIEAARPQAAILKARATVMATVAKGLSDQIRMALAEYALVANALPEELEPLEHFGGLCDGIAANLIADAPNEEIAKLVVAMAGTIGELNRRIAATRTALHSRSGMLSAAELRRSGFHTRLGERKAEMITSKWLWGGLFAGIAMLLGPEQTDAIGSLGQCYEDMIGPNAIYPPEVWAIPDYSEA